MSQLLNSLRPLISHFPTTVPDPTYFTSGSSRRGKKLYRLSISIIFTLFTRTPPNQKRNPRHNRARALPDCWYAPPLGKEDRGSEQPHR